MNRNKGLFEIFLPYSDSMAFRIAIVYDKQSISYEQLYYSALNLSQKLWVNGVHQMDRVIICTTNPIKFCIAVFACIYTGVIFVPIPMDSPTERKRSILTDSQPKCLLFDDLLEIKQLEQADISAIPIEVITDRTSSQVSIKSAPFKDFNSLAYIAYTSGSSGMPKGVCIKYNSIHNICINLKKDYGFNSEARVLPLFALHFDGTIGSIFSTIFSGGTLVFTKGNLRIPRILVSQLKDRKITHLGITPTVLKLILPELKKISKSLNTIKTVGLGGEVCRGEDVKEFMNSFPSVSVYNRYGPTETTVTVFSHLITCDDLSIYNSNIPIGKPLRNITAYIVDDNMNKLGPHKVGELCIGGVQVMEGYWRAKELTKSAFIIINGENLYKTGDLAYYNDKGLFFFVSRKNDMVKRNGNRIHLNEIENALQKVDAIDTNLCIDVSPGKNYESKIVAYIVPNLELEKDLLRRELSKYLPLYMLPDEFIVIDKLPMLDSGKVDRSAAKILYDRIHSSNNKIEP